MLPTEFNPQEGRVRVVRDLSGKLIGYQDPDQNSRFITREDAVRRLKYDFEKNAVLDSFGKPVGEGSFGIPLKGQVVNYKERSALYLPLEENPNSYRPTSNQEIIERVTVVTKEGRLITFETSYGLGSRFDINRYGGRYRQRIAQALELPEGERLPTQDLKRAVVNTEFLVKNIR